MKTVTSSAEPTNGVLEIRPERPLVRQANYEYYKAQVEPASHVLGLLRRSLGLPLLN
jgi:hypothetical protein